MSIPNTLAAPSPAVQMVSSSSGWLLRQNEAEMIATFVNEAIKLHENGCLSEAETVYRQILLIVPGHVECLRLLGVIFLQRGNHAPAIEYFDAALKIDPDNTLALNGRGLVLMAINRLDEALASYDRAVTLKPDFVEALANRGDALHLQGRFEDALSSYDHALASRPDNVAVLINRGNVLKALQRREDALQSYETALLADPNSTQAHANRASVLCELGLFVEALAACEKALAIRAEIAEIHAIRGNALFALRRHQEALGSYDAALTLRPDLADAHYNRGIVLHELRRLDEAVASYDQALTFCPRHAGAYFNRGNAMHLLRRFEDALDSYDRALVVQPDRAEVVNNRGLTLHEMNRHDEALRDYERAAALRPDFADAHYNGALCRLALGDYHRGWQEHERRWETTVLKRAKRSFQQPLWLGAEQIEGKTILLHHEQGLGDTIQFCRYAPLVSERGARVVLQVQEPLRELIKSLRGDTSVVGRDGPLPDVDLHCPLLSLPLAFATQVETIPSSMPYLSANPAKVRFWQGRLGRRSKPRIGIAWAGNPRKELPGASHIDGQRSLPFAQLAPLLHLNGCQFYSLQKGDDAVQQMRAHPLRQAMTDWTDELCDFADTAALIENLDLVISVDTSVTHLAGALGKPVWLLNRYNTCWRWLLDREDSPWYPTLRQFRQDASRGWEPVIGRVAAALRDYCSEFDLESVTGLQQRNHAPLVQPG
ncbi:MAG TPA: tetratricopeptide repeat protein [Xanthobacteraceae bacterium]|nr:tetratricopeptide repeat protein [Xanthobacteraceae bacterium]